MKDLFCSIGLYQIAILIFLFSLSGQAQTNSISGIVFDQTNRQPVTQVDVELMNELYSTLKRTRTDGSGRYYFSGISAGSFKIKVLTYATNYETQTQDANIVNFGVSGGRVSSDNVYLDFYLKLDPRKINTNSGGILEAVFVQEIPSAASKLYNKALSKLGNEKDEGLTLLEQAIQLFPEYYNALNRLGNEYVHRKEYAKAISILRRATTVNQKSFSSFYALGVANFNAGFLKEAVEAMHIAVTLDTQSTNANLWYGRLLRMSKNYELSEKTLLKLKESLKKSPIADVHWQLALLYNSTKKYKNAAEELESFLKVQPDSRDAEQIKRLIAHLKNQ